MAGKKESPSASREQRDRQTTFGWSNPGDVLHSVTEHGGDVVYEAPDTPELQEGKAPAVPRVRVRRKRASSKKTAGTEPASMGLPFGTRDGDAGQVTCWSCARELQRDEILHQGPGNLRCVGCGARLPFAD